MQACFQLPAADICSISNNNHSNNNHSNSINNNSNHNNHKTENISHNNPKQNGTIHSNSNHNITNHNNHKKLTQSTNNLKCKITNVSCLCHLESCQQIQLFRSHLEGLCSQNGTHPSLDHTRLSCKRLNLSTQAEAQDTMLFSTVEGRQLEFQESLETRTPLRATE